MQQFQFAHNLGKFFAPEITSAAHDCEILVDCQSSFPMLNSLHRQQLELMFICTNPNYQHDDTRLPFKTRVKCFMGYVLDILVKHQAQVIKTDLVPVFNDVFNERTLSDIMLDVQWTVDNKGNERARAAIIVVDRLF